MIHSAPFPGRLPGSACLLFALCLASPAAALTEVCGTVRAAEWTAGQSPYLVTGDLYVPASSRLRIGPGVTVRFARSPKPCQAEDQAPGPVDWSDSAYVGIRIEGQFEAVGTEEAPIVFEPAEGKGGAIGWDGLRFSGATARKVEIGFAVFRGANHALRARQSAFFVHHAVFEDNNTGISLESRADLAIVNCVFAGNRSAGLAVDKARPRIAASVFAGNRGYGIWSDGRLGIRVAHNAFWGNREADCYRCPHSVLPAGLADTVADAHGNLGVDPVFEGSPSHRAALQADESTDTPAHLVKDKELARLESASRAASRAQWAKTKAGFKPQGTGPYRLSAYSPLIDQGPAGAAFQDRDGSRGDIGLHGGTMGRLPENPF